MHQPGEYLDPEAAYVTVVRSGMEPTNVPAKWLSLNYNLFEYGDDKIPIFGSPMANSH